MISKAGITESIPLGKHTWISLVGGGGKTTLMQEFARAFCRSGKTVLMTTTTKIQNTDNYNWDSDFIFTDSASALSFEPVEPCVVLYAEKSDIKGKFVSPDLETLGILKDRYDVVLCEADGSRHLPVKVHTERDPVIPSFNDFTVCIAGAWAFGKKAIDVTFGLPEYKKDSIVDESFLDWYISNEEGLLKRTRKDMRCIVITRPEIIESEYLGYFEKINEKVFLH